MLSLIFQLYNTLSKPGTYYYRLRQIDFDGSYEYSQEIAFVLDVPKNYELYQNYPNPFNPQTTIQYAISAKVLDYVHVTLHIYNLKGKLVCTLVDENKSPGNYHVIWDGCDNNGNRIASGLYVCKMIAGDFNKTIKMLIQK